MKQILPLSDSEKRVLAGEDNPVVVVDAIYSKKLRNYLPDIYSQYYVSFEYLNSSNELNPFFSSLIKKSPKLQNYLHCRYTNALQEKFMSLINKDDSEMLLRLNDKI